MHMFYDNGYMIGMHLMRMIGDLGQYRQPIPDFLVFLGWTELPTFWKPFSSFPFALAMVLLFAAGLLIRSFQQVADEDPDAIVEAIAAGAERVWCGRMGGSGTGSMTVGVRWWRAARWKRKGTCGLG